MMHIIGLTGGIASGKSQVSRFFKDKNVPVIDADEVVANLYKPHSELLQDIKHYFGEDMILNDETLNRQALGELIFNDQQAKEKLNALIHPRVFDVFKAEIKKHQEQATPLLVLDVPLLFESGFDVLADEVYVVSVDEETQLKRLTARDNISKSYAQSKINSQMPLHLKCQKAHHIIDNNGTIAELNEKLTALYDQLMRQK